MTVDESNGMGQDDTERADQISIGHVGEGSAVAAGRGARAFVLQVVQKTGLQPPPDRNLNAQLVWLRGVLPNLVPADQSVANSAIEDLEDAIAALPKNEQAYRKRLRARFSEDAAYYIDLAAKTTETSPKPDQPHGSAPRSMRRRRRRAMAEYHEWILEEKQIKRVQLESLRAAARKYRCIILLGEPGSGKTTALEHLAYQHADELDRLPVALYLSGFQAGMSIEEFITESWSGSLDDRHWRAPELAANLKGYLENGKLFLLFDALNEMPRQGHTERAHELRRFIDHWTARGNRFLVTCRVLDYSEELSGLQRVEVQPLSKDQIVAFLQKELPDDWQRLWGALEAGTDEKRRLLELARNPYLLTIMIDIFIEDGELGNNRAELMQRFTELLMNWAYAETPRKERLGAAVQRESLCALAYEMQARRGSGAVVETELVKTVMPSSVQTDPAFPSVPVPPEQVLTLASRANLIEMPVDRSSVRFYHQLLQEYFAARQMLRLNPADQEDHWRWPWLEKEMPLWERSEGNYDPLPPPPTTGWEETTIMATGLAPENDDQLVQALIRVNPVLAGRCLQEGQTRVAAPVRKDIIKKLLETIADPDVALRVRLSAGEVLGSLGDPRLGELVPIPAGEFLMGDDEGRHNEQPKHTCFLSDYQIGKYPVTNAEYSRFLESGGYSERDWWTKAGWTAVTSEAWEATRYWADTRFNKPNQPVVGLSWYEAVAYCKWLWVETGQSYRLPTEAEWEKAARGGVFLDGDVAGKNPNPIPGRYFPWGDTFDPRHLNSAEGNQVVLGTTPVGLYPTGTSPYGLYDCAGNAWEWCATRSGKSYPYDTNEQEWVQDYLKGRARRLLRGGSFSFYRWYVRCASRRWASPDFWYFNLGFRVVVSWTAS